MVRVTPIKPSSGVFLTMSAAVSTYLSCNLKIQFIHLYFVLNYVPRAGLALPADASEPSFCDILEKRNRLWLALGLGLGHCLWQGLGHSHVVRLDSYPGPNNAEWRACPLAICLLRLFCIFDQTRPLRSTYPWPNVHAICLLCLCIFNPMKPQPIVASPHTYANKTTKHLAEVRIRKGTESGPLNIHTSVVHYNWSWNQICLLYGSHLHRAAEKL